MSWQEKIEAQLKIVRENVPLDTYTTLHVGGCADFLVEVNSIDGLVEAVVVARNIGAPYRVVGLGSNIIPSNAGFPGLIIINRTSSLSIDATSGRVIADSGVPLARVILEAAAQGLGGLEALYGIPGTVGGATVVNAGTHGVSVGQYVKSSSVLVSSEKIKANKADWFEFSYRSSRLKYNKSDSPPVVLNVIFQLQRRKKESILDDIAKAKKWREEHQPIGKKTCGSIFRNPVGKDNAEIESEKEKTAGWLLDQSGAKKLAVGGVHVSKIHANWIENVNYADALDVRTLIEKMRLIVNEKYNVELEEEVEYIGVWDEVMAKNY
jgi:UDP-N-acetylmuramate dehydrogenase